MPLSFPWCCTITSSSTPQEYANNSRWATHQGQGKCRDLDLDDQICSNSELESMIIKHSPCCITAKYGEHTITAEVREVCVSMTVMEPETTFTYKVPLTISKVRYSTLQKLMKYNSSDTDIMQSSWVRVQSIRLSKSLRKYNLEVKILMFSAASWAPLVKSTGCTVWTEPIWLFLSQLLF